MLRAAVSTKCCFRCLLACSTKSPLRRVIFPRPRRICQIFNPLSRPSASEKLGRSGEFRRSSRQALGNVHIPRDFPEALTSLALNYGTLEPESPPGVRVLCSQIVLTQLVRTQHHWCPCRVAARRRTTLQSMPSEQAPCILKRLSNLQVSVSSHMNPLEVVRRPAP